MGARALTVVAVVAALCAAPRSAVVAAPGDTSTTSTLPAEMPAPRTNFQNAYLTMDTPPVRGLSWPRCEYAAQVYCVEPVTEISPTGVETVLMKTPFSNCHNNDYSSRDFCSLDGSDWMEMQLGQFTEAEMNNTYRWKVRSGRLEPNILMLGDTQKTKVTGDATVGWTIEITAKPAVKAYKQGCNTAAMCGNDAVAENVTYSIAGYMRMLGVSQSWPSVASTALRANLRGTFISTNGMAQSWEFGQDTFKVSAVSPHFLPDGKTMTPGFVKVFLPEAYVLGDRGYKNITEVTPDRFALTLYGAEKSPTVTVVEGGLLVDTGVTHYSDPSPTLKLLRAGEGATGSNSGSLQQPSPSASSSTSAASNFVRTAASGAKATLTINLTSAQKVRIYRKVGSKLTLLKTLAAKKGTNKYVTVYRKTYSFVVKDAKGKTIPPRVSSRSRRFALVSLR
ncbi:MAG: hypothetical protein RJB57_1152 [Actinomycetota bacterium]